MLLLVFFSLLISSSPLLSSSSTHSLLPNTIVFCKINMSYQSKLGIDARMRVYNNIEVGK